MGFPRIGVGLATSLLVSLAWYRCWCGRRPSAQAQAAPGADDGRYWVYVGTYTGGRGPESSRGIYLMELDVRSGELGEPRLAAASPSPSFLAIHPNREFLYAVNEDMPGSREGASAPSRSTRARGR